MTENTTKYYFIARCKLDAPPKTAPEILHRSPLLGAGYPELDEAKKRIPAVLSWSKQGKDYVGSGVDGYFYIIFEQEGEPRILSPVGRA